MSSLANLQVIRLGLIAAYLAAPPAWDYFRAWASAWSGKPGVWVAKLCRSDDVQPLQLIGQLLYGIGVPYAATLFGIANARSLGLAGLSWWPELPVGLFIGLAGIGYLAWSWHRLTAATHRRAWQQRLLLARRQTVQTPWGWVPLLVRVLCLQCSWAFVRGAVVTWLGLYYGTFASLALLVTAWFLRPGRRMVLTDPSQRAETLLTAELALLSSFVFLYAENLWLCIATHGLAQFAVVLATGRAYAGAKA